MMRSEFLIGSRFVASLLAAAVWLHVVTAQSQADSTSLAEGGAVASRELGLSSSADAEQASRTPRDTELAKLVLTDVQGGQHRVTLGEEGQAVAFIFLMHDCPVANSYAPEIGRTYQKYSRHGVAFYLVHVDPDLTPQLARQHAREYQLPGVILLDPEHSITSLAGVTRVPEAAVFSREGRLVYRGRIDNLYAGFGKRRVAPTERDLHEALDALLAGRPVPPPGGEVIGCPVPQRRNR